MATSSRRGQALTEAAFLMFIMGFMFLTFFKEYKNVLREHERVRWEIKSKH